MDSEEIVMTVEDWIEAFDRDGEASDQSIADQYREIGRYVAEGMWNGGDGPEILSALQAIAQRRGFDLKD